MLFRTDSTHVFFCCQKKEWRITKKWKKRVQDYTQEILDTIRSNSSPAVMGSRLEDYHENDLADVLPLLTVPERCKLYRILDTDMLSDIFEYAESDNVAEYLEEMDVKKAASILSKMETDALAEVLQKLDKAKKKTSDRTARSGSTPRY